MSNRPDWDAVWQETADAIAEHIDAGRQHLITEDTVRFAAVLILGRHGVEASRIAFEVPDPAGGGGRIDLLIDPDGPDTAAVEFKYPRGSRGPISPDTMTLGALLRDFYRLAALPYPNRFVVQVLDDRIAGYLDRLGSRLPLRWTTEPGAVLRLEPSTVGRLPATARNQLTVWYSHTTVEVHCTARHAAGALKVVVYTVDHSDGHRSG